MLFFRLAVLLLLFSCNGTVKKESNLDLEKTETLKNFFAGNFIIQKKDDLTILTIKEAWKGCTENFKYVLYPKNKKAPTGFGNAKLIPVPLEKVICTGTTQVAMMNLLELNDRITGLADAKYIFNSDINQKISSGKIAEIGNDNAINYEKAIKLNPELVFTYSFGRSASQKKFEELGLPTVMISEFMEESPLGRAEWMVFMACFFGKEEAAIKKFEEIAENYKKLTAQIPSQKVKPTVMTGVAQEGIWYQAGGKSFMAKFIEDAGGQYLWSDNQESGGIPLSFETVLQKAGNADYWLNVVLAKNKKGILDIDRRYQSFKAFQKGNIYSYTARISANGGYDFYESAIVRPDLVLADLIQIFYPKALTDNSLYYYQKID